MLPFKTLLTIDRKSATPVFQQIANGLMRLIRESSIRPGSSLPSGRKMAEILSVHRKTVVAAYDELFSQDWIEILPKKGVLVSSKLPEIKPRTFINAKRPGYVNHHSPGFRSNKKNIITETANAARHHILINDGFPDYSIAPADELMKEYRRLFKRKAWQRRAMYGDEGGSLELRNRLAKFLSVTRGLNIESKHIMTTHGAQMALYIAAHLLVKPGAEVIVGEPNYRSANMIFQNCGAKLIRVPVDENGIDIDAIEKICRRKKAALLYIIPHHHHPTTVTLSAERRMKLLQLIREFKLPVIEDDYDYDFHYSSSPILPLASADHNGHVVYIGSLTKTLWSSVRIGYMVATEDFVTRAVRLRKLIDIRGDDILEEALAILFKDGTMQRHLNKSLKLYHKRRNLFCSFMQKELSGVVSFHQPSGGMALWTVFHKKYPLPGISRRASAKGLFMSDGLFYNSGSINYNALRMGYASLQEQEMEEVIAILKSVI